MEYSDILNYWQKQNIKNSDDLRIILNGHIINFAYHSGKIENPSTTYDDTREIFNNDSVCNYTGDLRTLYEIRNAKDAINMVLDAFDKKQPINEEFVKKIQYELTKNTYDARRWRRGERPGTYKQHDYIVGKEEVGASAEDTPFEMAELLNDIQDTKITSDNVIKAAAYLHCKMENIHPFSDGNGRTGRLLVNHLLMQYNNPPMIIFNEDKKEYFKALRTWDEKQSISEMVIFIKQQVVKTWEKQVIKIFAIPRKLADTMDKLSFAKNYNALLIKCQNEETAAFDACKSFIKTSKCDYVKAMNIMYDLLPQAKVDDEYPLKIINKVKEDPEVVKCLAQRDEHKERSL